jgi:hypothetical protein
MFALKALILREKYFKGQKYPKTNVNDPYKHIRKIAKFFLYNHVPFVLCFNIILKVSSGSENLPPKICIKISS